MDFGNRMTQARKQKGLSREELGELIGTSAPIVGRYERNDMKPSIEIAAKVASALDVSLDYLVGNSSLVIKDSDALKRLEELSMLPQEDKEHIFYTLDGLIKAAKLKTL